MPCDYAGVRILVASSLLPFALDTDYVVVVGGLDGFGTSIPSRR
jgi:hypothetical protein